ncbi:MAG: class I mannose-6-phosphate isomerase [FCB group bacterium]|jgi:mannose-6-phosphate isomerase|nr:class I mannose-6-phosphate isomerase [FCB group bacterium]
MSKFGPIRLNEQYQERIWGGQKLRGLYGKAIPSDKPIGEAWMVSDHPGNESVVTEGPHAGRTLHDLIREDPVALLGTRAQPTPHGRFPLLLKILDAREVLSVQVHPDDETARRLNEPDVGKTEMWHVLQHEPDAQLICGIYHDVTRERFLDVADSSGVEDLMIRFEVEDGTSVFVPAGTVHAIGAGIVLAEIQQNSDITYRLYDFGRLGPDGRPRQLHVQKAFESIHFGSTHGGPSRPLAIARDGATRTVLAACRYFAAESIEVHQSYRRVTGGNSFHILLAKTGSLTVTADSQSIALAQAQALLLPGELTEFTVEGPGAFLDYYVPDLQEDILTPLQNAGHTLDEILPLGGDPKTNDLISP